MKRNTFILAAVCLSLHAFATWLAFRGNDIFTSILIGAWLISLVSVFVVLCRHSGNWHFRLPALALASGYTTFLAYCLWSFLTHAD